MTRLRFLILLLIALASPVLAQEDCPTIVQAALAAVDSACSATSRNQVCYGNIRLVVTPRAGAADFQFTQTGDVADVASIQHLQLSSFSLSDHTWGLALMKLQANLPDTLPGQNVTFLLFGDVQIENAAADTPDIDMTAARNANVRSLPTTKGSSVIGSLKSGETVTANGRLADNSWVRIKLDGETGGLGWVSAPLLNGDLTALAVIEPNAPHFGPMQSFYFKTGSSDRPCDQAPDSGILVQSPQGAGRVTLTANGVDITLGSTVYLQASGGYMTVTVVEGGATLTAGGQSQPVPAGTAARVPLGADGLASGAPEAPQGYDAAALQTLPLSLGVWETVGVAPALTAEEISDALATLVTPESGTWSLTVSDSEGACRFQDSTAPIILIYNADDSLRILATATGQIVDFSHTSDTSYTGFINIPGNTYTLVFTFSSATTFTGTYSRHSSTCDGQAKLTGVWQSP